MGVGFLRAILSFSDLARFCGCFRHHQWLTYDKTLDERYLLCSDLVKEPLGLPAKPQLVHGAVGRVGEEVGWRGGDAGHRRIPDRSG
jgi:hypothetical protein